MAEHLWTVVSQRALVDGQTNNTSIVDVLEQINVTPPPKTLDPKKKVVLPMPVAVTSLWRRDDPLKPENQTVRLVVRGPNNKELLTLDAPLDMRRHLRHRVNFRLNGFPFHGGGTYKFDFEEKRGRKWRRVDRQYVELIVSKTPPKVPRLPPPVRATVPWR